jgi:hypothetical protein
VRLRTRITRLEKAAGVGQPPCLEDYVAALKALKAGAAEVRVGTQLITRAEWLASVADSRRREAARRLDQTGSAELAPGVEARTQLPEGALKP